MRKILLILVLSCYVYLLLDDKKSLFVFARYVHSPRPPSGTPSDYWLLFGNSDGEPSLGGPVHPRSWAGGGADDSKSERSEFRESEGNAPQSPIGGAGGEDYGQSTTLMRSTLASRCVGRL